MIYIKRRLWSKRVITDALNILNPFITSVQGAIKAMNLKDNTIVLL
jgi:hypothetical protein